MGINKLVWMCILHCVLAVEITIGSSTKREERKLFGGYRITPRFCKPTRKVGIEPMNGPSICMFNHECSQRNGQVVGACMDGFLFGACCQLPAGSSGELLESDINPVSIFENVLSSTTKPEITPSVDIMTNGMSQITQSLLEPNILPTAQDNAMVQINIDQTQFSTTGIKHPIVPDTVVINGGINNINPTDFHPTTKRPSSISANDDMRTTVRVESSTSQYGSDIPISVSITRPSMYTSSPGGGFQRPGFRPKPIKPTDADKYVLVPTIIHSTTRPNKTQEIDSIVNIIQMLNGTVSSTRKPPSTSYVSTGTSTDEPGTMSTAKITSRKPPSTSYVFSTTVKPRRTTSLTSTTSKNKTTTKKRTKPTKSSNKKTTTHGYSTTNRPSHSTFSNSPSAFITTKQPPSTSYVYSVSPTRRPPATVNSYVAGPGFSVTSTPGQYSGHPSAAPTVIVLGPVTDDSTSELSPNYSPGPAYTLMRPNSRPQPPQRKPVNSVTINNHVTQNIYSTSERPLPTVLITPKPNILSTSSPSVDSAAVEFENSPDQLSNFPPVRNPNLNMSNPVLSNEDITTPIFVEDDVLDEKMESFVNKIIQGLQEPFNGLRDVVDSGNNNKTTSVSTTTKKPVKKQGSTTRKPSTTRRSSTTVKVTRRPTTKRTTTTKRTVTTTKKVRTTRKPTTTTESLIVEDNDTQSDYEKYRNECGIRPLLRSSRIVGGKGASFGEFPWQVLVRESTWLGLFTKNKCGGVLISNKYVMTAAHCQPGFLASLVAVFGEFDISGDLESRRPLSRNVKRVIVHRKYDAATFENDLALLELESPVRFDAHIIPICLPNEGEDFTGRMATVTGWGRLKYGGGVPSVLQEVQVPIMENVVCQEMFRTAGHSKVILESFLCAGYANGQKDSCEGDSGGPLVLQRPDGRYQLAGTVSHGIKCAAPYLPGVYMRTSYYQPWIKAITGIH